jgi:hypothetical protein
MSAPPAILRHPLSAHAASPAVAVRELSVAARREGNRLNLAYRLVGNLDALSLPERRDPARVDGLWRHTCFEAFIGRAGSPEYLEFNFSPSGQWAAYQFSGYRAGMRPHDSGVAPALVVHTAAETLELSATVEIPWLTSLPGGAPRLGVTAVIEERSGGLSYWALKHPAEKPDFHHPDSQVIDVL